MFRLTPPLTNAFAQEVFTSDLHERGKGLVMIGAGRSPAQRRRTSSPIKITRNLLRYPAADRGLHHVRGLGLQGS
jgi:hypothetical protein